MFQLARAVTRVNRFIGKWASLAVLVIFALLLADVVMRYLVGSPAIWTAELAVLIFGVYAIIGGGYLLTERGHVNVDIIYGAQSLRRRAMRQLWRLNPVLANLDGLNDYDGDFTNAATDAPGVKTAYQVGKGLLRHVQALEEQERAKIAAQSGEHVDTPQNLSEISLAETDCKTSAENESIPEIMQEDAIAAPASATMVVGLSDGSEYANGTPLDTVTGEPTRPRRMRFRTENETG